MNFTDLIDLAGERLGGAVLLANDEFFAPKENLIRGPAPVWKDGVYTERGKWMDGWETRRRRSPGHDWCILRLGRPGRVRGVVVDTSFFTGNYPESCSLEGCSVRGYPPPEEIAGTASWIELLPRTALAGDTRNEFEIEADARITHVRLNIFPDGGVARLRVHGDVMPDWADRPFEGEIDLAAAEHGGLVVACSDMFYGNRQNLIMPGPSLGMFDGWETKRRRGPGHDWVVVRLAARGRLHHALVDTSHFKGNAPGSCSLEAYDAAPDETPDLRTAWRTLLPEMPLQPHTVHEFPLNDVGEATFVRLNVYPDGGIARLRLFGTLGAQP